MVSTSGSSGNLMRRKVARRSAPPDLPRLRRHRFSVSGWVRSRALPRVLTGGWVLSRLLTGAGVLCAARPSCGDLYGDWFDLVPVRADFYLHAQRDDEVVGIAHLALDDRFEGFHLIGVDVEDELVVDLEHHLGPH